jgi:AcrR family transcriptional regulator
MIRIKNPKTVKGMKAKEKILDVVLELFEENGYEKTTINDICERADISNGAFYHYFKSKQDILIEVLADETKDLLEHYNSLALESAVEKLYRFLGFQFKYFDRKGKEFVSRVFMIELETKGGFFHLNDFIMTKLIRQCIEEGQTRGEITDAYDSEFIANMLTSSILHSSFNWMSSHDQGDFKSCAMPNIEKIVSVFRKPN